jgi:transcription-repair coupling factor (superfamily II helicase)
LAGRAATDFTEFEPDDYVVHLDHGIGRFVGLQSMPGDGESEALLLEYAGDAGVYVRLDQAWQVARYVGVGRHIPNFRSSVTDVGHEPVPRLNDRFLITLPDAAGQAERDMNPGFAFGPDTHWQGN